ncbi:MULTISPECIES: DUF1428 domain-containing protein [Microbulbifer]|uniref:DUF1428 domain-containing protein n=1 Tax=Microbulbifer TaxID=48073 RepID=UPI001E627586|nr:MULTISPECIES: DUF1428 domain-containing protein [Microbulbifer]UHQ55441.1 DUF1428 domain-containing protein [Microbulbifer sp. YPW16]
MNYIDAFVIPVPTANKKAFIEHAERADPVFMDLGATRVVECWADDVPEGKHTDFQRSVALKADESLVYGWVEWPDKAVRDAAMAKMMDDPRMNPESNPMPFDGKRMIFGGFVPVVNLVSEVAEDAE